MTDTDPNGKVALNPRYGSGIFRRRIRMTHAFPMVEVELEDCSHAMRLRLQHDNRSIIDIAARVHRAPVSSCQHAPEILNEFVGLPLASNLDSYRQKTAPNAHCTHLYDMALLAVAHCQATQCSRQIDVTVHDEQQGVIDASIFLDGKLVHQWLIENNKITYPTMAAGQPVFKGFVAWAKQQFSGDHLSCALALQRGLMVAGARRWDMHSIAGHSAATFGPGDGVCYSYSDGREQYAVRSENPTRDFTETPEQLLMFL